MTNLKLIVGSDHAGFPLKQLCLEHLPSMGYHCEDLGTHSTDSCDYPEFALKVSRGVLEAGAPGLLVCGSGLGMSMAANRVPGIRAALCTNEYLARMARRHNDANILCLGARVIGVDLALAILDTFLATPFEGGRHSQRVELMDSYAASVREA